MSKIPQIELNPKLIEAKGARLLREKRVKGDPAGACEEKAPRTVPWKENASSGNQPAGRTERYLNMSEIPRAE